MRLAAALLLLAATVPASDWPRFRGPNGAGISSDKGLPTEFGPEKNLIWKSKMPKGNSSPVIVNDRILLTGWEGDSRFVISVNAGTGEEVWRRTINRARTEVPNPINGFTTPSVATDGKNVFAFIPEVGLLAYTWEGRDLWKVELGPFGGVQGMAVSPVYFEGRVYLLIDTPEQAWIAAYEAASGKIAWKSERTIGLLGGYATPAIYTSTTGRKLIIASGALELTAYDAKTGEKVWWARGVSSYPAAPPLVTADAVYTVEPFGDGSESGAPPWDDTLKQYDKNKDGVIQLSEVDGATTNGAIWKRILTSLDKNTGNNDGKVTEEEFNKGFTPKGPSGGLVKIRIEGKGDVSKDNIVWRYTKGVPYVTSPLLYKNVVYLVRNGGIVIAFDPENGKVLKEARLKDALGEYYASPIAAEDHIYYVSKDGKITVTTAAAEWEVAGSGNLEDSVIATPAIANNRIFVRSENALWCFGKTPQG